MQPSFSEVRFCIETTTRWRVRKMVRRTALWGLGFLLSALSVVGALMLKAPPIVPVSLFLSLTLFLLLLSFDILSFMYKLFTQMNFQKVYTDLLGLSHDYLTQSTTFIHPKQSPLLLMSYESVVSELKHSPTLPQQDISSFSLTRKLWGLSLCHTYCRMMGVPSEMIDKFSQHLFDVGHLASPKGEVA